MDRDALRKQLYDELNAQFEAKLREAKRQKSQLEEEMELSSEKWRNERRRLNSEIDRLESKLEEAREARKKPQGPKPARTVDASDIGKMQVTAAEEKLKKATQEYEADREKLQGEVSRLQRGIADLIERSNNPLRTSQVEKEKFETKFEDAVRAKRQAEDALLAAKSEWDQEKLKLVSEMVKLRRTPSHATVLKSQEDEERIEQLERQLQEAIRSRDGLNGDLEKARQEAGKLKQSYTTEIDALSLLLERSQKESASIEKQLKETGSAREKLERELEKTRQAAASLKSSQTDYQVRFKEQLEDARTEAKASARRLEETRATAAKERVGLEKQLREATAAQEKLERELDKAKQIPVSMKETQSAEVARLRSELESARSEARLSAGRLEETKVIAARERASLEKQLRETSSAQEKLERELDRVRHAPVAAKDSYATEVARLKQDLETSREEAKTATARAKEIGAEAAKERSGLERQLREASAIQQKLERDLDKARIAPAAATATAPKPSPSLEIAGVKELEAARAEARIATAASKEHAATIARLNTELNQAREAIQALELHLAKAKDSMSSEIVDQLRNQYDERMQEVIQQKSALSEQLRGATSLLEAERVKLGASETMSATVDNNVIDGEIVDAEVARIQEMIAGIARIIDDPETELSTVIRKNVERAELDAYLKGILFSLGRGRGL